MITEAAPPAALRENVIRGLAWKMTSLLVGQCARTVVTIVLARILAPHDYGVAAMVLVFSSLVAVFSDLALGAALVQRPELTEDDCSTVFWTALGAGAVFTLAGFALAGPIADFYGQPEVKWLFMAMSVSFVITSAATVQSTLLVRTMQFRSLEVRTMVSVVIGAAVGLWAALQGYGAWAIILQQVAGAFASTALLWAVTPWRPRFRYSVPALRSLAAFSANVFGTRLLFYVNRNVDNLLVGRFLGAASLGAYSIAYTIMLVPYNQVASPVQEVLFPAMSRMQDDLPRMAAGWLRSNRLIASISLPSLVGVAVVAPDLVDVVLGSKWSIATPVIQVLIWVGLLQSVQRLNSTVLQACDRTRDMLRYSVIVSVGSLAAFVIGLHWGVVGVAAAYALSSTVIEPYYTWLTTRALGISILDFGRALAGVVEACVVMGAAVLAARLALTHAGVATPARLGLEILVGIAVYLPVCRWREPLVEFEIRDVIAHRKASRAAAAALPG
jgi:O-antigen/teichoic acid export membrane protein